MCTAHHLLQFRGQDEHSAIRLGIPYGKITAELKKIIFQKLYSQNYRYKKSDS